MKVMRLSDITDLKGKTILPNIKEGNNARDSNYTWPNQILHATHINL